VVSVDPRYTAGQRCSKCGHVHRRNRPTQSLFRCQSCGYEVNADLNGARNVAWKYLAGLGKSEARWQSVNLTIVGEGALHLSPASPRLYSRGVVDLALLHQARHRVARCAGQRPHSATRSDAVRT
jgi:rubredoxin